MKALEDMHEHLMVERAQKFYLRALIEKVRTSHDLPEVTKQFIESELANMDSNVENYYYGNGEDNSRQDKRTSSTEREVYLSSESKL